MTNLCFSYFPEKIRLGISLYSIEWLALFSQKKQQQKTHTHTHNEKTRQSLKGMNALPPPPPLLPVYQKPYYAMCMSNFLSKSRVCKSSNNNSI